MQKADLLDICIQVEVPDSKSQIVVIHNPWTIVLSVAYNRRTWMAAISTDVGDIFELYLLAVSWVQIHLKAQRIEQMFLKAQRCIDPRI